MNNNKKNFILEARLNKRISADLNKMPRPKSQINNKFNK